VVSHRLSSLTGLAGIRYQKKGSFKIDIFRKEGPLIEKRRSSCLIATLITLSAVLTFTSCSSSSKTEGSAGSSATPAGASAGKSTSNPDDLACKLVTQAEAEAVMGEKLKDGDSGPASMQGGSICRYDSPDSMSARSVMVRVEAPNFNWEKFKEDKRVEGEKMAPKKGRIRQVPGLGKDAYFARHTLFVLTDKGAFRISIFKDPADAAAGEESETKAEAAEKTLAEKAVTRM
jgi:hypothetical protein